MPTTIRSVTMLAAVVAATLAAHLAALPAAGAAGERDITVAQGIDAEPLDGARDMRPRDVRGDGAQEVCAVRQSTRIPFDRPPRARRSSNPPRCTWRPAS